MLILIPSSLIINSLITSSLPGSTGLALDFVLKGGSICVD